MKSKNINKLIVISLLVSVILNFCFLLKEYNHDCTHTPDCPICVLIHQAENINKLFTKFERLDTEMNSTTEGTGLGLAITKALVEMMGGKINVQSKFGQGSIFMAQIPQKISKLSGPIQVAAQPKNNTQDLSSVFENKKILIVDDNKLNIKVAKKALQDFNFEIDECYDGQECLDKVVNGNEYDLILMDIMMPNMSGESAITKLKEKPKFNIPTIALTADAVADAEEKYKSEGFADYIAKPFKKEQIQEKLETIFLNSNVSKDVEKLVNTVESNNNDTEEIIFDIEQSDNIGSNEENNNELDSQLVSALSDMSMPLNKIDIKDKVLEDVHVIGENEEDEI